MPVRPVCRNDADAADQRDPPDLQRSVMDASNRPGGVSPESIDGNLDRRRYWFCWCGTRPTAPSPTFQQKGRDGSDDER
jgi:hypothetical protein